MARVEKVLDGIERPRFNSRGNSIHPTEQGIRNFWNWFRESAVVDEQGHPCVVYHGSVVRPDTEKVQGMGDIEQFDRMFTTKFRAHSIDTVGSWFSSTPDEHGANLYSGNSVGSVIYPVYLSIQNPHVTTFELMLRRARLLANGEDDGRLIGQAEVNAYRQWLQGMGKDGIKIEASGNAFSTEFDHQVAWIALEPEQIKSAIGNSGTFDPTTKYIAEPAEIAYESDYRREEPIQDDLTGLGKLVVDWLDAYNPFEDEGLYASNVHALYLVGSRAKGTARSNSDFDVAVVFDMATLELDPEDLEDFPTALKLSEQLHMTYGASMPIWKNVDVDIQIFFSNDKELETYTKIDLTTDCDLQLNDMDNDLDIGCDF